MDENVKEIADMYFASALLAYGANLVRIDKSEPRRQKFCFEDVPLAYIMIGEDELVTKVADPSIDEVESKFFARKLWLPPDYSDAIRRIKTAIYA